MQALNLADLTSGSLKQTCCCCRERQEPANMCVWVLFGLGTKLDWFQNWLLICDALTSCELHLDKQLLSMLKNYNQFEFLRGVALHQIGTGN